MTNQQVSTIEGRVRSVIYSKDDFRILGIENDRGQRMTIKGGEALQGLDVGEQARFMGKLVSDKKFGDQLQVSDVQRVVPRTQEGLIRWLDQVGIKGVGLATARKLVAFYGSRTVDAVLAREAGAVALLGANIDAAVAGLEAVRAEEKFGPLLAQHDIGPALRRKIYELYGMQTEEVITKDPYRVIAEVPGVAFATADKIALATGLTLRSEGRIRAAIFDTLRAAAQNGHTFLTLQEVAAQVFERTKIASRNVFDVASRLEQKGIETVDVDGKPGLALSYLARAERTIATRILAKLDEEPNVPYDVALSCVLQAESSVQVELNAEQRLGAIQALLCPISVITGGPGTGKTTTLKVIVAAWKILAKLSPEYADRAPVLLSSPTGKASKRMTEVTKIKAMTFHRLLEIDKNGRFKRNSKNPLQRGLLACDEVSMSDVAIFSSLSVAWGRCNILLVGDVDQLESVGAGRVFADIIESGEVPVARLVEVRRQAKGSAIALGAAAVREGKAPVTTELGGSDLVFIEENDAAKIAFRIAHLFKQLDGDVQVLCPGHKDEVGTISMNQRLQAVAGTSGAEVRIARGQVARKGDKVIQTDNDYDRDVYNGDSGIITEVVGTGGQVAVQMGDDLVTYDDENFSQLDLAWALSVHKSQGSEYETVIIPLHQAHYGLLKRTILYTAMTRAKKKCIIIGSRRAFARALANDEGSKRRTMLRWMLQTI
ncbi:AAA family ATPase [Sphingomonas sp. 3-13AW]|uniref:SF1B family DNA helicase RecD2 n=1 Tax=Sphingomonas sp. 3-13AW TaxID=3050450 RepID=UPI003BB79CC0